MFGSRKQLVDSIGDGRPPRWRDGWPVRLVAVLTTGYSVAITVSPRVLAKPCNLLNASGGVPRDVAELTRSIGVRDAAMAVALAAAPVGYPMSTLTAARVVSDGADAIWFARLAPPGQRGKIAGVAAGWAALELTVWALANRSRS
jgi:hypothetical protein